MATFKGFEIMTVEQWFLLAVDIYYSNPEKVGSLVDRCRELQAVGIKWVAVDSCIVHVIHYAAKTRRDLKSEIEDFYP